MTNLENVLQKIKSQAPNLKANFNCIGVLTITMVGSNVCTKSLVDQTLKLARKKLLDNFQTAPIVTAAEPLELYYENFISGNGDLAIPTMVKSIARLKSAGAKFVIIPSNTPHYWFDALQKMSPLPILNLIEITADYCANKGYKKIAVLGTQITMGKEGEESNTLYGKVFGERAEMVKIPKELRASVEQLIKEVNSSDSNATTTAEQVKKYASKVVCDTFILACSELPAVFIENNPKQKLHSKIPALDNIPLLTEQALLKALYFGVHGVSKL